MNVRPVLLTIITRPHNKPLYPRVRATQSDAPGLYPRAGLLHDPLHELTARIPPMIEHTVTFRLIHDPGSPEENVFLAEAAALATIPTVTYFLIRRQTSPKLDHPFGITMWFANRAGYDTYNTHPDHLAFLERRWFTEVASFQEADFEAI